MTRSAQGPPTTLAELVRRPVKELEGLRPRQVEALAELGIETLYDLLTYFPRRYVDRSREALVADAPPGTEVLLIGRIERPRRVPTRSRKVIVEAELVDRSGSVGLVFFNQPYRANQLAKLEGEVAVFGRIELFRRRRQMVNPLVDPIGDQTGGIVPLYPLREAAGLSSSQIARSVQALLGRIDRLADTVPPGVRERVGLIGRHQAFLDIHRPDSFASHAAARHRIAFDELFRLQIRLGQLRRERERGASAIAHDANPLVPGEAGLVEDFLGGLGLVPTAGQRRAMAEIAADMASNRPMHRLLQGDVGSGKTLVAVVAMLIAVQSGHQAALVAPTEVLAEQHEASIAAMVRGALPASRIQRGLFEGERRPIQVALVTGSVTARTRRMVSAQLAAGEIDIVVGTHALFGEGIEFADLGLVVIDEQHRFGVEQRSNLIDRVVGARGVMPDQLVMTATPIPRTAAMTLYGDLDLTVIDDLPPGRVPVTTQWEIGPEGMERAFDRLREEVAAGRQAYVVCPAVEGTGKLEVRAVTEEYERLGEHELAGLRLGLVHGRLRPREKEEVMGRFRARELDVLVATTVIEVGVDVPNATVMVIEDADRFGIAQLHQLRGRVGRGADRSWCFVLSGEVPEVSRRRLEALVATTDGFKLAEVDLELRGEGTVLGARQAGRSDLKLASILRDRDLIERARAHAQGLLAADPSLEAHPVLREEVETLLGEERSEYLLRS